MAHRQGTCGGHDAGCPPYAEQARTEQGVADIQEGLAVLERCIAATDRDLQATVRQRAPDHDA